MPLSAAEIARLIPHAGRMCLLAEVLHWSAGTIRCISRSHRDANNPMRGPQGLPALCGIEYAAQAMAAHGRLSAMINETPRAGFIASVSDVVCGPKRLDAVDGDLLVEAELLAGDEERVLYQFALNAGGVELLRGKATVILDASQARK